MDIALISTGLEDLLNLVNSSVAVVPHAALKQRLERIAILSQTISEMTELRIINDCIRTLIDLEPQLKGLSGLAGYKGLLNLVLFICKQVQPDPPQPEPTSNSIRSQHYVLNVYRARADSFAGLRVLVVVTTVNIELPSLLSDGTIVLQINICERSTSAHAPPAPPHQYTHDPSNSQAVSSIVRQVHARMTRLKNVYDVTYEYVRGAWCILVGVTAKGFVPMGELRFPKSIQGFPVIVCEYRVITLGRERWSVVAPQPQAGGACGPASAPYRMGTMGPPLAAGDGKDRFCTCHHVFKGCAVGERAIVPGMVARAMNALHDGGFPDTAFQDLLAEHQKNSEAAVNAVIRLLPAFMHTAEQDPSTEVGTLVHTDDSTDIAIIELDEGVGLSRRPLHWSDVLSLGPFTDGIVQLTPETSWAANDLSHALDASFSSGMPMKCVGYGATSGLLRGSIDMVANTVYDAAESIYVHLNHIEPGDSGATLWTEVDGVRRVVGMLKWKSLFDVASTGTEIARGFAVPAWVLLAAAASPST